MIVKIQKPLMTNGQEPMALIYNRSKSVWLNIPFHMVSELFQNDELKIYADVKIKNKKLIIREFVDEQDF